METITNIVPRANCTVKLKSNMYMDAMQDMIMATEVAKPFSILSAYLTTTATMRPPAACNMTKYQTKPSKPLSKLFLVPSFIRYVTVPNGNDSKLNCTFLIHT